MTRRKHTHTHFLAFTAIAGLALHLALPPRGRAETFTDGHKATVKGTIVGRSGDIVRIQDKKSGKLSVLKIGDDTRIERLRGKFEFFRHTDMDVTALVPGLSVEAEGVGDNMNELVVHKIRFNPDIFAIEVAEEQQVLANQTAAEQAQSSATTAQNSADSAQTAANIAQSSANQAGLTALAAGDASAWDAAAVQMVNQRVSELSDYKTVTESDIFFPTNDSTLDTAAKADLDTLAASVAGVKGYLIEIAGHASSTGPKQFDQKLSEERAAAVADYLRNHDNIPMRRIVAPAGYGASHPIASNADSEGRALNRRVDIKVLVNPSLQDQ